ncbi:universal stress protein [Rubrimonas cliftonensis]|uniref:Universal stress protein family protein n=1 Tax=Rubrimonas cliftonensis TaxID=89524 RepID=A0A1H3YP28_9RHOB|nr:universal stress protein [Rubrimonas cliftonensis]SEA13359.1 Universal stress protein family protein [Rubrimonas cliftonensis]
MPLSDDAEPDLNAAPPRLRVLGCIDGSLYSPSVAQQAAWAAARLGLPVELLQVLGRRSLPTSAADDDADPARAKLSADLAALESERTRLLRDRGRLDLEEAQVHAEAGGAPDATLTLCEGDLLESLARRETETAMVVIGKRGVAADYARGHLGSNLERVARASTRPLLVASRSFRTPRRMAIAFDAGPSAQKALESAAQSSLFAGLVCDVLAVGPETLESRRRLEAAASRLRAAGRVATPMLLQGQADVAIAEFVASEGVDLLLMGAYSHSRLRTLMLGSTTAELIRSCHVPLVLYR